jgi:hypothetical protein
MAAQIMISYSMPLIFAACIGLGVGNFLFSGVIGDQVIISRIKRKIKHQNIMIAKINEHNIKVKKECFSGNRPI